MGSNEKGGNEKMPLIPSERERRRFTRIDFATSIEIVVGSETVLPEPVFNVSVGGIMAHVPEPLTPKITVTVRIRFEGVGKGGVFIEAVGEVIRSSAADRGGFNVAIHFIEMNDDSYHHLRKLVLYNSANPKRVEKEL